MQFIELLGLLGFVGLLEFVESTLVRGWRFEVGGKTYNMLEVGGSLRLRLEAKYLWCGVAVLRCCRYLSLLGYLGYLGLLSYLSLLSLLSSLSYLGYLGYGL